VKDGDGIWKLVGEGGWYKTIAKRFKGLHGGGTPTFEGATSLAYGTQCADRAAGCASFDHLGHLKTRKWEVLQTLPAGSMRIVYHSRIYLEQLTT